MSMTTNLEIGRFDVSDGDVRGNDVHTGDGASGDAGVNTGRGVRPRCMAARLACERRSERDLKVMGAIRRQQRGLALTSFVKFTDRVLTTGHAGCTFTAHQKRTGAIPETDSEANADGSGAQARDLSAFCFASPGASLPRGLSSTGAQRK